MKRIIVLFLMCLLLLPTNLLVSATPVTGNQEDLTLTINYFSGHDEPVVGATLKLYQIAAMDDSYNITADSRFARFREQLEGKDTQWDILALTLRQYIIENEITCDDEDTVDTSGQVHFPASNDIMSPGIYLVCGPRYRTEEKIYTPAPVIITLPNFDQDGTLIYHLISKIKFSFIEDLPVDVTVVKKWQDLGYKEFRPAEIQVNLLKDGWQVPGQTIMLNETNGWSYTWNDLDPLYYWSVAEVCPEDYDVTYHRIEKDESVICTVINKYNPEEETPEDTVPDETKPEETIPSKPKPDEPEKLPQTGQLTWPIPWMVISGMMLFIIGWLLSKDSGKGRHEK